MSDLELCKVAAESGESLIIGWQLIEPDDARAVLRVYEGLSSECAERFEELSWADKIRFAFMHVERAA